METTALPLAPVVLPVLFRSPTGPLGRGLSFPLWSKPSLRNK